MSPAPPPLRRRALAELLGTALLTAVVVGSGAAAERLSPQDVGMQLLENSTATALGLAALIVLFGPVSGAHLNPVVSAADWFLGRRSGDGLTLPELTAYLAAQVVGAVVGVVVANLMFDTAPAISAHHRATGGSLLAEVVATTFLVALVLALARTRRSAIAAPAIGAYLGAAYWFTSSTAFANPAVTIGRVLTGTFAGIAPASAAAFIGAQAVGLGLGVVVTRSLYPVVGAGTEGPATDGAATEGPATEGPATEGPAATAAVLPRSHATAAPSERAS